MYGDEAHDQMLVRIPCTRLPRALGVPVQIKSWTPPPTLLAGDTGNGAHAPAASGAECTAASRAAMLDAAAAPPEAALLHDPAVPRARAALSRSSDSAKKAASATPEGRARAGPSRPHSPPLHIDVRGGWKLRLPRRPRTAEQLRDR